MKRNIYIKTSFRFLAFLLLSVTLLSSCAKDPAPVLYDVYKDKGTATPVVTAITPADSAWAGYDEITITGQNFLTPTDTAVVYFDNVKASIIDINPTQIRLKAPNLPKDGIGVRVFTRTSSATSEAKTYKLKEIMSTYKSYSFQEEPRAITFDKDGNLYVSLTLSGVGVGVKKIAKNGTMTDYAPKGVETSWSGMKFAYGPFGATGQLLTVFKRNAIFKVNPGAAPAAWVTFSSSLGALNDLDLDPQGNIWAAGSGTNIFRVKSDKTIKQYANFSTSSASINAVRVFNAQGTLYLYLGGTKDGKEGIWRYKITNQEIDPAQAELVVDFAAKYPGKKVLGLTFSEDGDLYVGTDDDAVILVVKSSDLNNIQPLLKGVLLPKFSAMAWGNNEPYLYYSREKVASETDKIFDQKLFKAYMFKKGAPYYGLAL
ncbi:MAG: IPT/TIG domain-containing protein [Bacillota bacterium]